MTGIQGIVTPSTLVRKHEAANVRAPLDWWPCATQTCVVHLPTRTIFEFYPVMAEREDEALGVTGYRARLVHVCAGHAYPTQDELYLLCQEAVVMGLSYLGLPRGP
jgi:hypothetical protein